MADKKIPEEILGIGQKLDKAGYGAYLVGGCVRDILFGELGLSRVEGPKDLSRAAPKDLSRAAPKDLSRAAPRDWDIATNARPEEIQKLFPDSVYENKFGTVGVKTDSVDERLRVIEITTFRLEGKYSDKRHPDEIKFAKTLKEDLSRRDFTVNAIALDLIKSEAKEIIDPFHGQEDLQAKIIRAVGKPEQRFTEDALRLMRAVRFAVQLDFSIEKDTGAAIRKHAALLEVIAKERIRDELIKIIMTPRAAEGIQLLEDLGLLQYIMPELREGISVSQNKHHIYTVWEHNLRALQYATENNFSLELRLASLLHDVGKPQTKAGEGPDATFYNHDIVGAKMVTKILDRLVFPKAITEKVIHLVRYHLFYYNVGEVSEAGVRRFLARVGPENVPDLLKIREADRIGSGVPKAVPYKLRHLQFMIDKVKTDPISPKMLKVNGEDVLKILGIEPGPKIGQILSILLEEVIDEPKKNTKKYLESRIQELGKLVEKELVELSKKAKNRKEEFEGEIEEKIKKKHYVK